MKLFIPELGTQLKLCQRWNFALQEEKRNVTFAQFLGLITDKTSEDVDSPDYSWDWNDDYFAPWDYYRIGSLRNKKWDRTHRLCESVLRQFTDRHWNQQAGRYVEDIITRPVYHYNVSLPKNTILKVDRVYIRAGAEDFSSVTFKYIVNNRTLRFWAKLADFNRINATIVEESNVII